MNWARYYMHVDEVNNLKCGAAGSLKVSTEGLSMSQDKGFNNQGSSLAILETYCPLGLSSTTSV
jgi:hypothetical protein